MTVVVANSWTHNDSTNTDIFFNFYGVGQGNTIILLIATGLYGLTVTDNTGTFVADTQTICTNDYTLASYSLWNAAAGTHAIQINSSGNHYIASTYCICDISGLGIVDSYDNSANAIVSLATTTNPATITSGAPSSTDLMFAFAADSSVQNNPTGPAGWTSISPTNTQYWPAAQFSWKVTNAQQSGITFGNWPNPGSGSWIAQTVGYKAQTYVGPTRVFANGTFAANSVVSGGLPPRTAMRMYANGTVQVVNQVINSGAVRLYANGTLSANNFI